MLRWFWLYRLLIGLYFLAAIKLDLGAYTPIISQARLYYDTSLAYLALSLIVIPAMIWPIIRYAHLAQLFVFTDIVAITLLTYACGGVVSGMGAFLAVSLGAAGLLIGGRCALLFAALASLAVLSEEVFMIQTTAFNATALKYSGLLGSSFFTVALLTIMLAQRVEQSTQQTKEHVRTIVRLEELNRYIIQHLQSGILIVDEQQRVVLSNPSLLRLIGLSQVPKMLADVSSDLAFAFQGWRRASAHNFAQIRVSAQTTLPVRFNKFTIRDELLFILLFEDNSLYNQRLQQGKLASLGRLSASIAHEIRNPLSAISHAAQLLSEATGLDEQDARLTEIIKKHCDRVNMIVEDVLSLSRRHDSQRQSIALDQWLQEFVDEQNELNRDYNQPFSIDTRESGLNAYIDSNHLKQILDNLCSNALRYGRPDLGKITLRVTLVNNLPAIQFLDHGLGVSETHLPNLFEPFFTTSHQGTGLGLYICRELAQLNQAELSYVHNAQHHYFQLTMDNADQVVIEL